MTGNLQPLDRFTQIVNPDGTPTLYFTQWAQQRQMDIGEGISEQQALELLQRYLEDHQIQAGTGIDISPTGDLSDSPTISAQAQEILDQITSTQGSVLFRGAAGWEPLAPGTSGQFLKTNGAGADPEWATGGGGGGGGYTLLGTFTAVGGETSHTFSGIPTGFSELKLVIEGRSSLAAVADGILVRVNSLSTTIYDSQRTHSQDATTTTRQILAATSWSDSLALAGATTSADFVASGIFTIIDPDSTKFKNFNAHARWPNHATSGNSTSVVSTGTVRTTSPISSIILAAAAGAFSAGTTFYLYGLPK